MNYFSEDNKTKDETKQEKQEESQQETTSEKQTQQSVEKLPTDFNKLVEINSDKARQKCKEMYLELEKKVGQHNDENKSLNNQVKKRGFFYKLVYGQTERPPIFVTNKQKNYDELSKTANQLRNNLKLQIEEVELTRKRLEREKEEMKIFAITKFAKEILEVQDNLDRALQASKSEYDGKNNSLYEGTKLTYKLLEHALSINGVEQDNPVEKKFDPNRHDALFEVDSEQIPSGHIAFVATIGYSIGDRVLRPAKVGVVRQKQQQEQQQKQNDEEKDDFKTDKKQ